MYTAIGTHLDIMYTMNKLCSFNSNPDMAHWNATKRVLRYLILGLPDYTGARRVMISVGDTH